MLLREARGPGEDRRAEALAEEAGDDRGLDRSLLGGMSMRAACRAARMPSHTFTRLSPTQKGEVKRDMGFRSPIGDSPFGKWLPKGHHLVATNSLVMLIPLLTLPFWFDLNVSELGHCKANVASTQNGHPPMIWTPCSVKLLAPHPSTGLQGIASFGRRQYTIWGRRCRDLRPP